MFFSTARSGQDESFPCNVSDSEGGAVNFWGGYSPENLFDKSCEIVISSGKNCLQHRETNRFHLKKTPSKKPWNRSTNCQSLGRGGVSKLFLEKVYNHRVILRILGNSLAHHSIGKSSWWFQPI